MKTISRFNLLLFSEYGNAIWNSITDCLELLSLSEVTAFKEKDFSQLSPSRSALFKKCGFIGCGEQEFTSLIEERHLNRQFRRLHFRILTTTACNARCSYCYEKDYPLMVMDERVADGVVDFIAQRYQLHPSLGRICLEWFGGEPTLNPTVIQRICVRLQERGIPFYSSLVSNGILLSSELLDRMVDCKLQDVQITLDGVGELYERIKAVPHGTFGCVIDNIDECLKRNISVSLQINYCGDFFEAEKMIHVLGQLYGKAKLKPQMYIAPMYESVKEVPREYMMQIIRLNDLLIGSGLAEFESVYSLKQRDRCFAATPNGFTIMPNGRLVNCSHCIDREQNLGTVWQYNENDELRQLFMAKEPSESCMTCVYYPICGGGCPAAQHGVASIYQCIPYKSVITDILRLRMKKC